jgi:uncharacterized membrane protein
MDDEIEVGMTKPLAASIAAAVGAAAFLAAQVPLLLGNGAAMYDNPGWFTNAGSNVSTIAVVVALIAAPVSFALGWTAAAVYALGAFLAMTAVLFAIGPGNLFPLTMAVGGAVLACATAAGAALGLGARALGLRHRR